jgi:hypothetical protein
MLNEPNKGCEGLTGENFQGTEDEGRKQFCLDLMDFTHSDKMKGGDGTSIVDQFLQCNPQWAGNIGNKFGQELKDFENNRPDKKPIQTATCNLHGRSGLNNLKNLCYQL